jgi:hypothetical protein
MMLKQLAIVHVAHQAVDQALWRMGIGDEDDVFGSLRRDYFGALYRDTSIWHAHVGRGLEAIGRFATDRRLPVLLVMFPVMVEWPDYRWRWVHTLVRQ